MYNLEGVEAVIAAAEEKKSPAILQVFDSLSRSFTLTSFCLNFNEIDFSNLSLPSFIIIFISGLRCIYRLSCTFVAQKTYLVSWIGLFESGDTT